MKELLRPEIIKGKSIITTLNEDNKDYGYNLLFHGRKTPSSELVPAKTYWKYREQLYPDSGEPVICASNNALIAVFMAIAPRDIAPFGYKGNEEGGINFYRDTSMENEFRLGSGFVATLDSEGFEVFNGSAPHGWPGKHVKRVPEMRSTSTALPLFNVEVTYHDFEELLAVQNRSVLLPYK
ncbi:MAG: hypothetical protein H0W89_00605 [Candidatus Levybacteria bacterium]|nr:hypothetical protein [Candidatus Levybacteria bacterium]